MLRPIFLRRWRPAWLRPGPSRLLGHWPRSAVTGRPVMLRDGSMAMPVVRHHRPRVGAELHVVGRVGGWRPWTPVFICR